MIFSALNAVLYIAEHHFQMIFNTNVEYTDEESEEF